jgi:calcineurin-like phosphoesterase family protein
MILFVADHHFGHANIIHHCGSPFQSAEEMDEALIANWNCAVKPQDTNTYLVTCFSATPFQRRYICNGLTVKSI